MQTSSSAKLSFAQILGIVGAVGAIISFFALPWYAEAAHGVSMGWMGSYQESAKTATAYELSQLFGILWLIPMGVALVLALLFVSPQLGMQASRIASLICGIVPFIIYAFTSTGELIKHPGMGFIIAAIGTLLAIFGVFTMKRETPIETKP
jgi:hypothetical protein